MWKTGKGTHMGGEKRYRMKEGLLRRASMRGCTQLRSVVMFKSPGKKEGP